jgi:hypothetical protein
MRYHEIITEKTDLEWLEHFLHFDSVNPEYEKILKDHAMEIIKYFLNKNYPYSTGNYRMTFIGDKYVFKVPKNDKGIWDNMREAKYYQHDRKNDFAPIAPCRIFYFNKEIGLPILVMEKVKPHTSGDEYPRWSGQIDSRQIGTTRKGNVVAYDL